MCPEWTCEGWRTGRDSNPRPPDSKFELSCFPISLPRRANLH
jgi:hypothetical protein